MKAVAQLTEAPRCPICEVFLHHQQQKNLGWGGAVKALVKITNLQEIEEIKDHHEDAPQSNPVWEVLQDKWRQVLQQINGMEIVGKEDCVM